jgi:hypothetical protein
MVEVTSGGDSLEAVEPFVGEWSLVAAFKDTLPADARARVAFEWLPGKKFLIERWEVPVPAAPDGIAIIGADSQERRHVGEPPSGALQAIALEAIEQQAPSPHSPLLFPAERGGYLDLHKFRNREWKPAQIVAGIERLRRIYDLRHTFATFALRAGISTFDLSRYMGASLTMIDRHYGNLARDGREHAIRLLDALSAGERPRWTLVDAAWTPERTLAASADNGNIS